MVVDRIFIFTMIIVRNPHQGKHKFRVWVKVSGLAPPLFFTKKSKRGSMNNYMNYTEESKKMRLHKKQFESVNLFGICKNLNLSDKSE